MRQHVLELPIWKAETASPDCLAVYESADDDHVVEGLLGDRQALWTPITRGVPCFVDGELRPDFTEFSRRHGLAAGQGSDTNHSAAAGHRETVDTFSDKWRRFRGYGLEPSHQAFLFQWYCKKLGVGSEQELREFYRGKRMILECGPGSGFNSRFMAENCSGHGLRRGYLGGGAHHVRQYPAPAELPCGAGRSDGAAVRR